MNDLILYDLEGKRKEPVTDFEAACERARGLADQEQQPYFIGDGTHLPEAVINPSNWPIGKRWPALQQLGMNDQDLDDFFDALE